MDINQAGIDLIKQFEGCKLKAYQDLVGVWTIGFGHTGDDVYEGLTIDESAAEPLLIKDLNIFVSGVKDMLNGCIVSSNAFSALVCFAYNVGIENLKSSTLLKLIISGEPDPVVIGDQFLRWDHAGGVVIPGLARRRAAERALFLS